MATGSKKNGSDASKPAAHSVRLRGIAGPAPQQPTLSAGSEVQIAGKPRRLLLGAASRDAADALPFDVAEDEVVRIEYDDDLFIWVRADDLLRERGRRNASRGGAGVTWDIDTSLRPGAGGAEMDGTTERGLLSIGIKALEFFGVQVTAGAASAVGKKFELHRLGRAPGLYRVGLAPDATGLPPLTPVDAVPDSSAGKPVLVFLHGTMSSLTGSFKALWSTAADEAGSAAKALRESLASRYGSEIYAFEHRTLSESPIRNALDLAGRLPEGVQLHLVSHSRGGLVGELLCLADRDKRDDPLRTDLLDALFKADTTVAPQLGLNPLDKDAEKERDGAYAADRKLLAELIERLDKRRISVQRFARVACPARGTTLASGRLDRWLSALNLIVPEGPGGLFGDMADFLLAVVKERTDPRTLPGVEAMMPGSALTRLLNDPRLRTASDLSVIAGDIEGSKLLGRLKVLVTDWFYGSDHDLVVNTGSMYGGITRAADGARFRRDQGTTVNHFRYFSNRVSIDWLRAALERPDGSDAGFEPIAKAQHEAPRWRAAVARGNADTTPKPIAIVVPGTMGSALNVDGGSVWLSYWALLKGGLGDIAIDTAGTVEPVGLLDDFYGPLLAHLARTHRVEVVPYDWRLSVREAAKRLTSKLVDVLAEAQRTRQPVHIVAHSMGGLVARAMIADRTNGGNDAWLRMKQLPGSRLLMLGTPNLGSHEAVRWLVGQNPTQAKLILLDFTRGTNGVIDVVRRFPGVAELLPFDQEPNPFAKRATWSELRKETSATWELVDDAALREAAATWKLMRESEPEKDHMVYVAGCQPATVVGYEVVAEEFGFARKMLRWLATSEGDGTVSWASGRLRDVPTYYAPDTGHDQLCSNEDDRSIFRGYVDLLLTGKTDQLPASPPGRARAAGAAPELFVLPPQPVTDDLPDEAAVRGFGFGGTRRRARKAAAPPAAPVEVSVRHGDLSYARHPVLVGHYVGDTIVSGEAALDRQMRGNQPFGPLSRRRELGLYPGPHGTHAIFFNEQPGRKPDGAIVVGLGQVGELSPGRLEANVRDALIEYALRSVQHRALERDQAMRQRRDGGALPARVRASVSALLVGTGASSLTPRESMEALLRGVLAANRKLEETQLDQTVLIDRIEFIELFEDLAIGAGRELATLLQGSDFRQRVRWSAGMVEVGEGRRRRSRFDADQSWWQRIEITEDRKAERLRFVATTDRARAEESLAVGQLRMADDFIADACGSAIANPDVSKTLFEMLLPQRLKEAAPDQRPLVLLVDEASARFPWEMLEDRWSRLGQPHAVTAGIVRQFKTAEFRSNPMHAFENRIYIVGNPDLEGWDRFDDLPAARDEAERVSRMFAQSGYEQRLAIGKRSRDIIDGLHGDAWRVLHLAGHGEHDFEVIEPEDAEDPDDPSRSFVDLPDGRQARALPRKKKISGMVIGKGKFLTPGDVEQMRHVPELVFINCCHLGRTGGSGTRYNRLAANLGVEFIRMGVRAVVCAGWAVGDAAALTFAETFYRRLLDGDTFGEAVHAARKETWLSHREMNTWGAYQCYGDPGYRLVREGQGRPASAPAVFVAATELVIALRNFAERARMQVRDAAEDPDSLSRKMLEEIEALLRDRIPPEARSGSQDWLARADVAGALGLAYGEAGLFAEAVAALDRAMQADVADCPVRIIEQRANFTIRLAAQEWAAAVAAGRGGSAARAKTVERIRTAMGELTLLCDRAPTAERRTLLGSAWKRLARIQDGQDRFDALAEMAAYCGAALIEDRGGIDAYSFNNAAVACLLLERIAPGSMLPGFERELSTLCERNIEATQRANVDSPQLWAATGLGDLDIVQLLLAAADDARCKAFADSARDKYLDAFARGASPREMASIRDHLDFLIELTADPRIGAPWPAAVRDGLASIRAAI